MTRPRTTARLAATAAAALIVPLVTVGGLPARGDVAPDDTPVLLNQKIDGENEAEEDDFTLLRDAYYETRLLAGTEPLSLEKAAKLRRAALTQSTQLGTVSSAAAPETVGGPWANLGPNPIVQLGRTTNTFQAVSGRIGALAVRQNGSIILGAAQGGIWTYDEGSKTWTSRTGDLETQSVGALAVAPSNDNVVYLGSGEGALSGDSYYGDGVYRSTDGGITWGHVSGSFFAGVSISDVVVDPTNVDHLYISVLRGRGGIRRTTPPSSVPFGIWESKNGGATWQLDKGTTSEFHGATDLVMDPRQPSTLYASFWGDGIYRTTDAGKNWYSAMGNLPNGQFNAGATRFSLGLTHPAGVKDAYVYAGFDYFDKKGGYHPARIYRTTTNGLSWDLLPGGTGTDAVTDYCGTQCFYDNVVLPDPSNLSTIYVAGSYGYGNSPQSGGIYRSTDGGQTWKNLGYDLHPDFHAIAVQPGDTAHVVIGNDGGVWRSHNRGGRLVAGSPLSTTDWENLNGTVSPTTAALVHSTGLSITQFTSMATVPKVPGQYWGGTQDNGTMRKSLANDRWFDQAGGDGGQVLVDPYSTNATVSNASYVFGTYFGISPYRFALANVGAFNGNEFINGGINLTDRAEFYVPWVMNKGNPNQLFLGTYRMYRTNNAEAAKSSDVHWDVISPDLTTGCTGTAPNGARGCFISAIGVADGGDAVYSGADDGKVFVSPDAVTAASPHWTDITASNLPARPVSQFAVDRSNWRIAYMSYAGFSAATPGKTGHVFKTTDGGAHWADATSNLPDVPVNSVVLDPAFPDTVYAGTDIGPYVTTNGGASWQKLGTAFPKVAVWQLDFDASHRVLAAGTHGRGAYSTSDASTAPALIVSKQDSGTPVGPGSQIDYTITVRNIGNAAATGVTVTDPNPAHTSFVSADNGGTSSSGATTWSGLTVPAGGQVDLHLSVRIDNPRPAGVTSIVDDGITVSSTQGAGTTGSPHTTTIAPPYALTVSPTSATDGNRPGQAVNYIEHLHNLGYTPDSYQLSASGTWSPATYAADCTTPLTTTATVAPGATVDVCVKVTVPASGVSNADTSTTSFTATSVGSPSVSGSATLKTIAVTVDTLLVDNDNNAPDVSSYYKTALTGAGQAYSYWDLSVDNVLPLTYMKAHKRIVWFTGNSYPGPVTPYETSLAAFLDGGGKLLMSGQDILDQAAGTTAFVRNYLHINWNGTEAQNDKATAAVHGITGNPVTNGLGAVPLDHSVLGNVAFEDQVTPIAPATAAFNDDSSQPDGLNVDTGTYKVVFLAFPMEAYGTAAQKADLVTRTFAYFGP